MTTYYLDYELGDNSKDGTSWTNAKKTINGFTSLNPGDVVRIAKSPDPIALCNATWTDQSKEVVLSSAQTKNIDLCETAWTPSANVTCSTDSYSKKQGSYSLTITIGGDFTTGKVAYKTLGSTQNFSTYQKISFWLYNYNSIPANYLKLCLCSDTDGNEIVDTFYIPAASNLYCWYPLTIIRYGGGSCGTSIQSIALYAENDPGALTLFLDDIIACTTNGLNLQSLISKNGEAQGGAEGYYTIQNIDDTKVNLVGTYSGTTEQVMTYKREAIRTWGTGQAVQCSGNSTANIEFQGGYNRETNEQDGETFFDGIFGNDYGVSINSKSYVTLNRLSVFRYNYGFYIYWSPHCILQAISNVNDNNGTGVYFYYSSDCEIGTINNINNNINYGLYLNNSQNCTIATINNINRNGNYGLYAYGNPNCTITTIGNVNYNYYGLYFNSSPNCIIKTIDNINNNNYYGIIFSGSPGCICTALNNINNNASYGIYFTDSPNCIIYSLATQDNSSGSIYCDKGPVYIANALLQEVSEVTISPSYKGFRLYSHNHDRIPDHHVVFTDYGRIQSTTTIRHSESGIAWQLSPRDTKCDAKYPLWLPIARVAVDANKKITVKCYFRRSSTEITGKLFYRGGQIAGAFDDVSASITADADVWQRLQIELTTTERGVIEIQAQAYGGTSHSVYVDDIEITQTN